MTESPTHDASMYDGHPDDRNNLKNIRGIGVARKQWLKSLGIHTIADLAHASADKIESQLKCNGRSLSRNELDEWIAQARTQLADRSPQSTSGDRTDDVDTHAPQSTSELTVDASDADTADSATEWKTIASFKLEYQTRTVQGKPEQRTVIHHLDTGTVESQPNFETHLLQEWLLDRVKASDPQATLKTLDQTEITPEICQLRVIQAHQSDTEMIADKSCPLFTGAISANEPFALEVLMQFSGLTDATLRNQVAYRVQCIIYSMSTGLTVNLGEVAAHIPVSHHTVYKALFPELILPNPGIYRLKVLVTLQNALATSGYFKVPMLQVV